MAFMQHTKGTVYRHLNHYDAVTLHKLRKPTEALGNRTISLLLRSKDRVQLEWYHRKPWCQQLCKVIGEGQNIILQPGSNQTNQRRPLGKSLDAETDFWWALHPLDSTIINPTPTKHKTYLRTLYPKSFPNQPPCFQHGIICNYCFYFALSNYQ